METLLHWEAKRTLGAIYKKKSIVKKRNVVEM